MIMGNLKLPTKFKPLGETFRRQGTTLRAVRRPDGLRPDEACLGCFFNGECINLLQCSKFDREDGISVWFKEVE